ncbi:hypothetical protein JCM8097_006346 [Rhodosporidiobolus ruineniae]
MDYSTAAWTSRCPPTHPYDPSPSSSHLSQPPRTAPGYQQPRPFEPQAQQQQPASSTVRRAHSTGGQPSTPAGYPFSTMPPSPVSPTYRGVPSFAHQQQQPQPPSNWFAASRDQWMQAHPQERPLSVETAPPTFAYAPPVTPDRRRRNVSAQAAFPTPASSAPRASYTPPQPLSLALPEHSAPPSAPLMSYSHTTPGPTKAAQQPTAEEVSQFFQEMTELLGPEAMAALSPTTAAASMPTFGASTLSSPPPTAHSSFSSSPVKPTYNVNGVLLSEEDYHRYAESPVSSRVPTPSQPFIPPPSAYSAAPLPPQHYPPQPTYTHGIAPQQAGLAPPSFGYDLQRPQSAPPTPVAEITPMFFGPPGSCVNAPPPPPAERRVSLARHRRGSSLDLSSIPRSIPSGLAMPASSYSYPPPPPPSKGYAGQGYVQPRATYQPPPPPPPSYFSPPSHQYPISPTPAARPRPPPYGPPSSSLALGPPVPASAAAAQQQQQQQQQQQGLKRAHGRKRSTGVAFINFSADDRRALLSGVAPSGTTKKRVREEEEAADREREREREAKRAREGRVEA